MAELRWEGCRPQSPHCPASPFDTQILFNHESSSFQMFSSEAYGQKNLLFKDSTLELVPIATQNYEAWLGHPAAACDGVQTAVVLVCRWSLSAFAALGRQPAPWLHESLP